MIYNKYGMLTDKDIINKLDQISKDTVKAFMEQFSDRIPGEIRILGYELLSNILIILSENLLISSTKLYKKEKETKNESHDIH